MMTKQKLARISGMAMVVVEVLMILDFMVLYGGYYTLMDMAHFTQGHQTFFGNFHEFFIYLLPVLSCILGIILTVSVVHGGNGKVGLVGTLVCVILHWIAYFYMMLDENLWVRFEGFFLWRMILFLVSLAVWVAWMFLYVKASGASKKSAIDE